MSLEEAAKLVRDGDHVGIGGCTMSRTPLAMIWALIRARKKDLTVSRSITSTEGDLLFASGVSKHVITSWFTPGHRLGRVKVMRHYTENKLARFEEWSHMSIGLRYRAGAMGIPFMPSRSMIGSDVASASATAQTMTCPFTGEELVLLPALNPDVALIHVQRCDAYGNAQLDGLQFMDIDMAMAANSVILTTERIVSNDQIRRTPDQTRIPFFTVEAVVEAPMGCAPHECYGLYEPFFSHLDDYAERTSKDPVKGCQQYLEEFYYGPEVLARLPRPSSAWMPCSMPAAAAGVSTMTKHGAAASAYTASELLAVMAARLLKDGQIVFAGVGIPLLAATLAQRNFAPHLTILFEGGTIGPFIVPGELPPSTNEQRCTRRANMVLPITDVLLLLQRGYVDVGFMGGAQIDRFGNLNSSFIGDADNPKIRLPGTGGGNDISSLTNMIVAMKHEKRRFVADVDFITSPGLDQGPAYARRARPAAGRHVARRHRPRHHGLRRGHPRDEGAGPAPGRHPRAGAGQYRLQAAVRRASRDGRAAAPRTSSPCCASSTPSGFTRRELRGASPWRG